MPLHPCEESLDDPAPLIATQPSSVLCRAFHAVRLMWRDHLDALFAKLGVKRIAVVCAVADQILRLRFDHVEVERQLHERNFVVIRRMRRDRQRQAMTIDYRHDFHAFSSSRRPDLLTAAFRRGEGGVDVALGFVDLAVFAKHIGKIGQRSANHFALAPLLKAAMYRLVVGVALRKHVPLSAGVQDPQHRFEHFASRNRLSTWTIIRDVFLGKMLPNALPLFIGQSDHGRQLYADPITYAILR